MDQDNQNKYVKDMINTLKQKLTTEELFDLACMIINDPPAGPLWQAMLTVIMMTNPEGLTKK